MKQHFHSKAKPSLFSSGKSADCTPTDNVQMLEIHHLLLKASPLVPRFALEEYALPTQTVHWGEESVRDIGHWLLASRSEEWLIISKNTRRCYAKQLVDRQAGRRADRQTDRQGGRQVGRQTGRQADR